MKPERFYCQCIQATTQYDCPGEPEEPRGLQLKILSLASVDRRNSSVIPASHGHVVQHLAS